MADVNVRVPVPRLLEFMNDALLKMGVPRADAKIVAEVLLAADLCRAYSHGIAHLKTPILGLPRPLAWSPCWGPS